MIALRGLRKVARKATGVDSDWAPTIGAVIGASAVLVSQLISWLSGSKRLKRELAQRDRESLLRYSEPLRDKSIDALETFHELLQEVIESGRLSERDYLEVRNRFAYLADPLRSSLLAELTKIARSGVPVNQQQRDALIEVQRSIRDRLKAPEIGANSGH